MLSQGLEITLKHAIQSLLIIAHFHGVAASEGDLLHRFSSDGKDLNQQEWLPKIWS